jgi:hypothetical protein
MRPVYPLLLAAGAVLAFLLGGIVTHYAVEQFKQRWPQAWQSPLPPPPPSQSISYKELIDNLVQSLKESEELLKRWEPMKERLNDGFRSAWKNVEEFETDMRLWDQSRLVRAKFRLMDDACVFDPKIAAFNEHWVSIKQKDGWRDDARYDDENWKAVKLVDDFLLCKQPTLPCSETIKGGKPVRGTGDICLAMGNLQNAARNCAAFKNQDADVHVLDEYKDRIAFVCTALDDQLVTFFKGFCDGQAKQGDQDSGGAQETPHGTEAEYETIASTVAATRIEEPAG